MKNYVLVHVMVLHIYNLKNFEIEGQIEKVSIALYHFLLSNNNITFYFD